MKKRGFTLIELSIVLVIIALIVSGVLVGKDLIRHAQLRTIFTDAETYTTAMHTFKLKYNGLAGDHPAATSFWPAATNGNGNGRIEWIGYVPPDYNLNLVSENFGVWQQLSLAGLIPGNYTGIAADCGGSDCSALGVNIPASKIGGGGFAINMDMEYNMWNTPINGNQLIFGGAYGVSTYAAAPLMPSEAYILDLKYDDGNPDTGSIRGPSQYHGLAAQCTQGILPAPIS